MDTKVVVAVIVLALVVLLWVYVGWYLAKTTSKSETFGPGYFDYNGTAPMYEEAKKAWLEASKLGNAHASYAEAARDAIEKARLVVLGSVGADPNTHTVIWTSGGSESNNLVLRGMADALSQTPKPHYILSETEHKTSLDCAKQLEQEGRIELTILPVLTNTLVCPYTMMNALKPNTRLVSIMHVNNESGAINNLRAYGQIIADFSKKQGLSQPIIFHTDAVQSMGKIPALLREVVAAGQLHAISFSAHKFGGPLGCGGLIISRELNGRLASQISGSQNYGLRGGTDNTPGIVATGVALSISLKDRDHKNQLLQQKKTHITQRLQERFPLGNFANYVGNPDTMEGTGPFRNGYQIVPMGAPESSTVPNTLWFSIVREGPLAEHFCNLKLQKDLEGAGYIVSVGSACNTGKGSHVLQAAKAPYVIRCGIVRVSLGDQTTENDCDGLADAIVRCVDDL